MSALAQTSQLNTSTDSVTSISVNSRIDYIFRFSKHAVLVVDENAQACSSVGYQFLDQLSNEHNAAFVSASTKLNNIQIRCRIIEQLFGNSVFDPEQSLAVSIINLLNANPQKLAIVLDNTQFASLQIIHELTQLALIAKKAKLDIELLMLGDYAAGKMLAEHKDLFHKKISILSKQSGQLLSLSAKQFKTPQSWLTLTVSKKWLISLIIISSLAIVTVVWLQQQETFNFSKLPKLNTSKVVASSGADQTVLNLGASEVSSSASPEYVYKVLSGNISQSSEVNTQTAEVSDIVSAIAAFEVVPAVLLKESVLVDSNENIKADNQPNEVINARSKKNELVPPSTNDESNAVIEVNEATSVNTIVASSASKVPMLAENNKVSVIEGSDIGNEYYKRYTAGYVIQIAGFTQESIKQEFLADFTTLEFKQYQRILNEEVMTVLTSKYYPTRAEAEQALYALPQTILSRSPWIKSISAINNEINAFERSQ
ncbi:SPOR domain-containing protein [Thalassotalea piscium]|uniref:DamX protein n=1 Tax=Thalassotalea piscium TaxID=1230533 RepID=A0A7X0NHW9_9GAMM|nr:hypothetical protein [Thalassotalea piscium]MBB6543792.1 DamX protein [Thalassotalea piscium]